MPRMKGPTDVTPVHNVHWLDAWPMSNGWRSGPASSTGCQARPSGNMRPAPVRRALLVGRSDGRHQGRLQGLRQRLVRTPAAAKRRTPAGEPLRPERDERWRRASGWPTAGSRTMQRPRSTAARRCRRTVVSMYCAAAPGATSQKISTVTTRNFYDKDVRYPANGLRVARDLE